MAKKLPRKDVVIIGLGWTGCILANELTDEGLDVIAIERGPWRDTATDYPPNYAQDELRYHIRHSRERKRAFQGRRSEGDRNLSEELAG